MKKKNLVLGFMLMMLLAFSTSLMAAGIEPPGNEVSISDHLLWISTNSSSWGNNFVQTANINASYLVSWDPIGNGTTAFTGTYNGNGCTIDGLHCTHPFAYQRGLFGYTNGAVISNLGMTNVEMNGDDFVGALVGQADYTTITNCYSTGLVRGQGYIGGLVGYKVGSSTTNCYSSATVTVNELGYSQLGGLIGFICSGTFSNCYSTGSVTGSSKIGGFVGGVSYYTTITNCYSTGNVNCSNNFGGGFIGINTDNSTISNCYSTGSATGTAYAAWGIAGFAGGNYDSAAINNCYSAGTVNGYGYTGGFVGKNYDSATISNCYSMGNVDGDVYVGGFMGINNTSAITNNCYSKGSVTGNSELGGFAGAYWGGTVTNSFWDTVTSGQTTSFAGTGKTTAEMTTEALICNYTTNIYLAAGWDFKGETTNGTVDIWNIGNSRNYGYPYFDWQYPGDDATLPVELSSFTAQFISNLPVLCWTTQSESGNAGWNVYRGDYRDAFINGDAIQINPELIEGAGTTSIPTNYTFEDQYDVIQGSEYWYILESIDYSGETYLYGSVSLIIPEEGTIPELPQITILKGNYPNPFNPSTIIYFSVKENETAQLSIFNAKGQEVETIRFEAGIYNYFWDASGFASGIYLYKLQSDSFSEIRKMLLLK